MQSCVHAPSNVLTALSNCSFLVRTRQAAIFHLFLSICAPDMLNAHTAMCSTRPQTICGVGQCFLVNVEQLMLIDGCLRLGTVICRRGAISVVVGNF